MRYVRLKATTLDSLGIQPPAREGAARRKIEERESSHRLHTHFLHTAGPGESYVGRPLKEEMCQSNIRPKVNSSNTVLTLPNPAQALPQALSYLGPPREKKTHDKGLTSAQLAHAIALTTKHSLSKRIPESITPKISWTSHPTCPIEAIPKSRASHLRAEVGLDSGLVPRPFQ